VKAPSRFTVREGRRVVLVQDKLYHERIAIPIYRSWSTKWVEDSVVNPIEDGYVYIILCYPFFCLVT